MNMNPSTEKFRLTKMALAVLGALSISTMAIAQTVSAPTNESVKDAVKPQDSASPTKASDASSASSEELQSVVVTGTSERRKKFDTPYAISTISEDEILRKAPKSTVDLLKSVPGVKVENSGGEGGGENVVIRGLPFSGFRLMDLLEDGLPLFESNFERQLQIDELYRVDLGTTGVEIVRGGTAPIYSNNASGGVVNFLSNHGTTSPEHAVKFTAGQHGLKRFDGASSGPINDNLLYSISGFVRKSDGLRDPGFSDANQGGQVKIGGTYLLDHGQGKLFADFKYLNDRNIFYSAIPLTNPLTGNSLSALIDPSTGTLDSASFRNVNIRTLDANGSSTVVSRNLADGIHPDVKTLTFGADIKLGDGWKLSDKARYTSGRVGFDALLNGAPEDANNRLSGSFLTTAQAAFAGTTSLRYVYAGTNTVFNPATTAGLTMPNTWSTTRTDFNDLINDARINKSFDSASLGKHDVSVGLNLSSFRLKQQQLNNTLLTNVKSNPDALDIQALDAAGNVTGLVTENGFSAYGSGDLIGDAHGLATSVYAAENWHINDAWQADVGVRHEVRQEDGNRGVLGVKVLSTTGPLAARSITGSTSFAPYSNTEHGTAWTLGSLYQIAPALNAFARYSSAYSLPRLSDQWGNINNGVAGTLPNGQPMPVVPIKQAEAGVKLSQRDLQVTLIGFWSNFKDLNTSTYVANAQGNLTNQAMLIGTTTKGIEFEGIWHPVNSLELSGSLTLQKPVIDNATTYTTLSASRIVGNLVPRTPNYMATLNPAYLFDVDGKRGRLYASFNAVGKSYQDFINTSILPAYRTVDLGLQLNVTQTTSLQFLASNLTNSTGLTEGNARAPVANTLTATDATVGRPIFGRTISASATIQW
jgi:outer membrane receptor protein involved in Fe transport